MDQFSNMICCNSIGKYEISVAEALCHPDGRDVIYRAYQNSSFRKLRIVSAYHGIMDEARYAIRDATFILVAAGAGFSADSGLAVYNDVASYPVYERELLTYYDLCQPDLLQEKPEVFYGFHGTCFNNYKLAKPHPGHQILLDWLLKKYSSPILEQHPLEKCMFVLTSNVDALFEKCGFPHLSVHPLHGEQQYWQCSSPECTELQPEIAVRPPEEFRFQVNLETMRAPIPVSKETVTPSTERKLLWENHPRCLCGRYLRPNIMMFRDNNFRHRDKRYELWHSWRAHVVRACKEDKQKRLVILELGCGNRVPTLRLAAKSLQIEIGDQATVVRVNPTDLKGNDPNRLILLQMKSKEALEELNKHLTA